MIQFRHTCVLNYQKMAKKGGCACRRSTEISTREAVRAGPHGMRRTCVSRPKAGDKERPACSGRGLDVYKRQILERGDSHEDHRAGVAMRFGSAEEAKQCAKALLLSLIHIYGCVLPGRTLNKPRSRPAPRAIRWTRSAAAQFLRCEENRWQRKNSRKMCIRDRRHASRPAPRIHRADMFAVQRQFLGHYTAPGGGCKGRFLF